LSTFKAALLKDSSNKPLSCRANDSVDFQLRLKRDMTRNEISTVAPVGNSSMTTQKRA